MITEEYYGIMSDLYDYMSSVEEFKTKYRKIYKRYDKEAFIFKNVDGKIDGKTMQTITDVMYDNTNRLPSTDSRCEENIMRFVNRYTTEKFNMVDKLGLQVILESIDCERMEMDIPDDLTHKQFAKRHKKVIKKMRKIIESL